MDNNNNQFKAPGQAFKEWFQALFDLNQGVDREGTVIYIKNNKRMYGANAWMLICSIMIASLGLDLNSPAVIIGAMLISPLMSPILGIGLGVAINDRYTLFTALQHFGISILIALVTSTVYFWITPFGDITDEIQSRTEPTLLDGLVAIFGGLAGIISTTRKDKSNAIPGVAIATALMPPLCVTGFGLANFGSLGFDVAWGITKNSFYLFFLNSFFIAATAYLIIRLLNFPLRTYVNKSEARRNRVVLIAFSLLVIIPSIQILLDIYDERQDKRIVTNFIKENIDQGDRHCKIYEVRKEGDERVFFLESKGRSIPNDTLDLYEVRFTESFQHENVRVVFLRNQGNNQEEIDKINLRFNTFENVQKKMEETEKVKSEQELQIQNLQSQIDSIKSNYTVPTKTFKIAKQAFPDLQSLYFANAQTTIKDTSVQTIPIFILSWRPGKSRASKISDQKKLYNTLKVSADLDTLKLVVE